MKLEGEYVFEGLREQVWEILRDPEVLATALPGTQSLEKVSESEYTGAMHVRIGPVSGVFAGRLLVTDEVPPESYTLTVEGKGAPGFAKGSGHLLLTAQEDGTTHLAYEGDMEVGGKLASVGQRLIDTASKSMIRQGLESLNAALRARALAAEEGRAAEYVPPTEVEFATAVAKDMAAQILPPPRTLALMAVLAALALAIGYWLGRKVKGG